jgi:hypothetical protein
MNERHFFADVSLPFHFWVRERHGARGFRWVLREASQDGHGTGARAPDAETPSPSAGD